MALALKPHPLGGALAGSLALERTDPADPARRGRMVVVAVMVRRAGHRAGAIPYGGVWGKGGIPPPRHPYNATGNPSKDSGRPART